MRITIISNDNFISIDGEGYSGVDLSFLDSDIHALQWYGNDGEIEYKDNKGRIVKNEIITSLINQEQIVSAWQSSKEKAKELELLRLAEIAAYEASLSVN